ncbi:hypothetical protein [Dactylosporangium sp. NPDC000521]|uniref:hypothetical protein n=1 Tax=Dactylosporangium sp. NPDC000521 TaxID=3363975 RepID=UPI0036BDB315
MRTVLRLLGTRYGIAMVLIVVVLIVVGFGRTVFTDDDGTGNDALGPTVAPVTTTPDPYNSLGDDGVVEEPSSAAPSLSNGTADASTVATRFAKAWLRKPGMSGAQWRDGLKPDATNELLEDLTDTDPNDVPAATITGPTVVEDFGQVATAKVPADGGTIILQLEAIGGRWQVTSLDWEVA